MVFQVKQVFKLFLIFFLVSCGGESPGPQGEAPDPRDLDDDPISGFSPALKAAKESAREYQVPEDLLLAAAQVETGLQPEKVSYGDGRSAHLFPQGGTAFAISRAELEIENDSTQDRLSTQVRAYARWLSKKVKGKELPYPPSNSQEKFDWIWEMALLHRDGTDHMYTERSVFVREMIEALEDGFYWFDGESNETNLLSPDLRPIKADELNDKSLGLMNITMRDAQVRLARQVFLSTDPLERPEELSPSGLLITHCPFALSVCLDMQNNRELMDETGGWTHYLIPRDELVSDMSLQVYNHHLIFDPKVLTGEAEHKIRIMLTGSSGRMIDGVRKKAKGDWLTHWQMDKLRELSYALCHLLVNDPKNDNFASIDECLMPEQGVFFKGVSGESSKGLFGIPDFDKDIFYHYLSPKEVFSEMSFSIKDGKDFFEAGEQVQFHYQIAPEVRYFKREELVRCDSETGSKLLWHSSGIVGVQDMTEKLETQQFWTWGPNQDGTRFFRAKFYDKAGKLVGWDSKRIRLRGFEERDNPILQGVCS